MLNRIRDFLASIYGPLRPLTDAEKYEFMGRPKYCDECSSPLRSYSVKGVVTVFCPAGSPDFGHAWFRFYPEELE